MRSARGRKSTRCVITGGSVDRGLEAATAALCAGARLGACRVARCQTRREVGGADRPALAGFSPLRCARKRWPLERAPLARPGRPRLRPCGRALVPSGLGSRPASPCRASDGVAGRPEVASAWSRKAACRRAARVRPASARTAPAPRRVLRFFRVHELLPWIPMLAAGPPVASALFPRSRVALVAGRLVGRHGVRRGSSRLTRASSGESHSLPRANHFMIASGCCSRIR